MCGLVGIVGDSITLDGRRFFEQALQVDTIRGDHSTGIMSIDDTDSHTATWYKDCVNAYDFMLDKSTTDIIGNYSNLNALLGHNRAATLGSVVRKNAHPFRVNKIILMHNGTLRSTKGLRGDSLYDVDSNVIAHSIDSEGVEATVSKLDGAFALVWYDLNNATINFCRNDERPLWFGKVEDKGWGTKNNQWIYASELGMLKWLAARNNLEVKTWFQLKTEKLLSFDCHDGFEEPSITDLKFREPDYGWGNVGGVRHYRPPVAPVYQTGAGVKIEGYTHNVGTRQEFYPELFEPSKHNESWGTLKGWLANPPNCPIEVRNVAASSLMLESVWEKGEHHYLPAAGKYESTILNILQHPYPYILLSPLHLSYKTDSKAIGKVDSKVIQLPNQVEDELDDELYVPGAGNLFIPLSEWREIAKHGCSHCSCDLEDEDANDCLVLDHQTILCDECTFDNQFLVGGY